MSGWFENYGFAEVFPDLVIGAYPLDADDVGALAERGVRRVLNLSQDAEYRNGDRAAVQRALAAHGIEEIRVELTDFGHLPGDQLDEAIRVVVGWMDQCEPSYVHCRAGYQRSASVAAGAVAVFNDIDIATALQWVRKHKHTADPLPHQRADLQDWWLTRGRREAAAHASANRPWSADPIASHAANAADATAVGGATTPSDAA